MAKFVEALLIIAFVSFVRYKFRYHNLIFGIRNKACGLILQGLLGVNREPIEFEGIYGLKCPTLVVYSW